MLRTDLYEGACDTHVHLYKRGVPSLPGSLEPPVEDDAAAYLAMRERLGLSRAVIVQPNSYGLDNRVTAEGIGLLGARETRGVAIVDETTTAGSLAEMTRQGFCGARFHMLFGALLSWDRLDRVAAQVAEHGWLVQLQCDGRELPEHAPQVLGWSNRIVIDHIGKFLTPVGTGHPAFRQLLALIDTGRVWVKLSAPYEVSRTGAPDYADVSALARALVAHAPERMLWASNWPHIATQPRPDDGKMLDQLADWAPDPNIRRQILCENPQEVYGFGAFVEAK